MTANLKRGLLGVALLAAALVVSGCDEGPTKGAVGGYKGPDVAPAPPPRLSGPPRPPDPPPVGQPKPDNPAKPEKE